MFGVESTKTKAPSGPRTVVRKRRPGAGSDVAGALQPRPVGSCAWNPFAATLAKRSFGAEGFAAAGVEAARAGVVAAPLRWLEGAVTVRAGALVEGCGEDDRPATSTAASAASPATARAS